MPWTRLADPVALARLGGSAVLGELFGDVAEAVLPADLVQGLVGGHDLTPFLMSERIDASGNVELGGSGGLLGEHGEAAVTDTIGVAVGTEYDELADDTGKRTGALRFEGYADMLVEVALDLSKTLGFDTTCVIPHLHGSCALVVPFTEVDGDKTFAVPFVEVGAEVAVGPVGVGGSAALGPAHAGIALHGELDPASMLWQKVLDDAVGSAIELATLGIGELETSGHMTVGFELSLDHPLLPEAASIAADVIAWLTTGAVSDLLADHLDVVEKLVDSADLTLGVDLTIAALHVGGALEAKEGAKAGVEGDAQAGLVYRRDDVLEALKPPPTVPEVLAILRDPSSVIGV